MTTTEKMIEKINQEIVKAIEHYNFWKNANMMNNAIERIKGMIQMLELVTGKEYIIEEDHIVEK